MHVYGPQTEPAGEVSFGDLANVSPEAEALAGVKGHLEGCLTVLVPPWDFSKVTGDMTQSETAWLNNVHRETRSVMQLSSRQPCLLVV